MNNITTNNLCIGIDLGTTNSVLATVNQKPNGDLVSKVINLPRAVDVFSSSGKMKPQIEKDLYCLHMCIMMKIIIINR